MSEGKQQEQNKVSQGQPTEINIKKALIGEKEDDRITGDDWKLDLSQEDRDIADEVEGKLKQVQKQMDMIEQKTKALQSRMNFPFGIGSSSSSRLPTIDQLTPTDSSQNKSGNPDDQTEAQFSEPQLPKINAKDFPVIDARGNLITDTDVAIERYHNSAPFFRCLQLPFCYSQIKSKIQFWAIASVSLGLTYEAFIKIQLRQSLKTLQFKPIMKKAGLIFLAGSIFSTIETIYFDDYWQDFHLEDFS